MTSNQSPPRGLLDRRRASQPVQGSLLAVAIVAAFVALAVTATPVESACNSGICSGNPCTVTGFQTIDNGCVLDWTGKTVTIASSATLQSSGSFTILAQQLTVNGVVQSTGAGLIDIQLTGAFTSDTNTARITANGGGEVDITATGNVTIQNQSAVRANGGGFVDICSGSRDAFFACVAGTGTISITSAPGDGGPAVSAEDAKAAPILDPGAVRIVGAAVSIGASAVVSTSNLVGPVAAGAGCLELSGSGNVTMSGTLRASDTRSHGFAGAITVKSCGSNTLTVSGTLKAEGGGNSNGADGVITLGPACAVVFSGLMDSNGSHNNGANTILYRNSLNTTGGRGQAGSNGCNAIYCRATSGTCAAQPTGIDQALWAPNVSTVADNTLDACGGCDDACLPFQQCKTGQCGAACSTPLFCSQATCTETCGLGFDCRCQ